ncbi:unnamed protein product [Arctia plantaginis]|uniref:Uncharacterized protein n=1 Tax=Arctia plantaginis TaxID=874455 RepID=A0A8S1A8P0_ARCPL|nr:unnamed protein product [Arctia plantaginis]
MKVVLQSSQEGEIQENTDTEEREELKQLKNTEQVSKEKDEESDPGSKSDNQDGMVFLLQAPSKFREKVPLKFNDNDKRTHWSRLLSAIAAGDYSERSGRNPRIYQSDEYPNFSRRFVPQYHYSERPENVIVAPDQKEIIPIQAPLEIVKQVAQQSVLEEAAKPKDDVVVSKALRTGDYWNAVWVEDVDPKSSLRMSNQHILGTIKAKIRPGSQFYDLVSSMTKISPRLLYIINDKQT